MINNCAKIHLIFDNLVIGNWEKLLFSSQFLISLLFIIKPPRVFINVSFNQKSFFSHKAFKGSFTHT